MISIGTWAFYSWASIQAKTLPGSYWELLSNISETLFGVATAGLLGGIVFEFFLRKDILTETRTTLAEIVTSEKNIVKELYLACIVGDFKKQQELIAEEFRKIFKRKETGKKLGTKWTVIK